MSALDEVLINARSDWGYNSFELAKIIMAEQEVYNLRTRIAELESSNDTWKHIANSHRNSIIEYVKRIAELEARFTEPEPQPDCKQNHAYLLEYLELQRDAGWLEDKLPAGEPIGKDLDVK